MVTLCCKGKWIFDFFTDFQKIQKKIRKTTLTTKMKKHLVKSWANRRCLGVIKIIWREEANLKFRHVLTPTHFQISATKFSSILLVKYECFTLEWANLQTNSTISMGRDAQKIIPKDEASADIRSVVTRQNNINKLVNFTQHAINYFSCNLFS